MSSAFELHSINAGRGRSEPSPISRVKTFSERNDAELARPGKNGQDEALLARLGKRQLLKRNFDFVSIFAFTCMVLVSWEGFYQVFFTAALIDGGPGSIVYGFLVVFAGTVSTFVSIGELASIAPTAGGQYHWVYMLGPIRSRRILSYLTGWMTLLSWQAVVASVMFTAGTILESLIVLNYPDYQNRSWHVVFYNWVWIAVAISANTVASMLLPVMQCAFLLIHVLGFIAVFIILCYVTPHGDTAEVFAILNRGDWPSQGTSVIVGLTSLVFLFLGTDAAVHMSEEIYNASINVPRSMLISVLVNGLLGLAVVVPTVYGLVLLDYEELADTNLGYPFIPLFTKFTGNSDGSTVICSLLMATNVFCLISVVTTTSRMIWAFARDQALPLSNYLSKIDKRTSGPLNAVLVTTAVSALLSLVNLGATIAFESLVSLGIAGFYSTYLACTGLLLWRRLQGSIKEPSDVVHDDSTVVDIHSGRLTWGPWRVKGWLGTANNLFACFYLLFIIFFSLWPTENQPQPAEMNYSVVIAAAVLLGSACYYMLSARHRYFGPVVEIIH